MSGRSSGLPAWFPAAVVAAAIVVPVSPAAAQDADRTSTVRERPRPEYDPIGIRAGAFFVHPRIEASESYRDNVFATSANEVDDFVTRIEPSVAIQSGWSNHDLRLTARGDLGFFADQSDENYADHEVELRSRIDIVRDAHLFGNLSYASLHRERSSPDDAAGTEPTTYTRGAAALGGRVRLNRLAFSLQGAFDRYDFDDTPSTGGTINHDDRDRDRVGLEARAGYEIVPEYEAFIRVGADWIDYEAGLDDNGINRDSEGFNAVVGARIDLTGVVFGDFYVGYLQRDFDAPAVETIDGLSFGADLTWNITRLTTMVVGAARTVEETTQGTASGALASEFDVTVDHELLRNLILQVHGGYREEDFRGIGREDEYVRVRAGATYLVNRYLRVGGRYEHRRRDSNLAGQDFDENVVTLRITGQY